MQEERRLVAILFADVTGSTAMGEGLDPEDVRGLMGRYYQHARELIPAFGGTLEKFIGDAVMAVFGIPRALGDDVERALAAALALRDAVAADPVLGDIFQLRIGVNLGEVVAPSGEAGDQFIASGDAMNTASRLQTAAMPGEILASERTVRAAEDMFSFGRDRVLELKGKRDPFRVFSLLGRRARRRIERPPMAGRETELRQLALVADRVVAESRPALVSLIGVAGIGKTRLAAEMAAQLDPLLGFRATWVGISPYGRTATHEPLRQLLDGLLGEEATMAAIEKALAVDEQRAEHHKDIAATIAASATAARADGAAEDWESVVAGWRFLVQQLAAEAPLAIVFDDVHLYGDELIGLIERLARPRARVPLMIVVLARPELLDSHQGWGGGRPNCILLTLDSLGAQSIESLIMHYQPRTPLQQRLALAGRSAGNPFFALELLRAARDRPDTEGRLPETVHAAILARIDLLAGPTRSLVRTVCAAGPALPADALAPLVPGLSPAELEEAIEDAIARDFLETSGAGVAFRHAMVRDVAYNSLSRMERIRIHAETAELLAGLDSAGDLVHTRAHHYRAAIALARQSAIGLTLPFDVAGAVDVLKEASGMACHVGALLEAQDMLDSATHIAPTSQHWRLQELLGDSVGWSPAAVQAYQRALSLLAGSPRDAADDSAANVRLRRKLLILLTRGALADRMNIEPRVLHEHYLEARKLVSSLSSEYERLRLSVVDLFLRQDGQYLEVVDAGFVPAPDPAERLAAGEAAAAYFASRNDWAACSEALDGCQSVADALGRHDMVLDYCRQRVAMGGLSAAEFGDALSMLSMAHWNVGDAGMSIAVVDQALSGIQRGRPMMHLSHAIAQAISAAYCSGGWAEAQRLRPRLEEAYEESLTSPQDSAFCADGFFCLFWIASAQCDTAQVNRFASLILSCFSTMPHLTPIVQNLLDMEIFDDPERCRLTAEELGGQALGVLAFRNERGLSSPPDLISAAAKNPASGNTLAPKAALALASGSASELAAAIEDLNSRHRVVPAMRLALVLAQLTEDRDLLDRSISALDEIGDLRFLRRAAGIAASLAR
jgi:class 3 adenylate cyclase